MDEPNHDSRDRRFRTVKLPIEVATMLERWRDFLMDPDSELSPALATALRAAQRDAEGRAKYIVGLGAIVREALVALRARDGVGPTTVVATVMDTGTATTPFVMQRGSVAAEDVPMPVRARGGDHSPWCVCDTCLRERPAVPEPGHPLGCACAMCLRAEHVRLTQTMSRPRSVPMTPEQADAEVDRLAAELRAKPDAPPAPKRKGKR